MLDVADVRPEVANAFLEIIDAIDEDLASRRLVETAKEIDESRFSGPGFPDDGDARPGRDLEIQRMDDLNTVSIIESHVLEFDFTAERLICFLFRFQKGPVFGDDLGGIDDLGTGFEQLNHFLGPRLCGHEFAHVFREPGERVVDVAHEREEQDDRRRGHDALGDFRVPVEDDQGDHEPRDEGENRVEEGVDKMGAITLLAKVGGDFLRFMLARAFEGHRFDRLGPGDRLGKIPDVLGMGVAGDAVLFEDLHLEEERQNRDGREGSEDDEGGTPIDREHGREGEEDLRKAPKQGIEAPDQGVRKGVGIPLHASDEPAA